MDNKFAGNVQQVLNKYLYKSTTESDVIGDTREKTLSGWKYTEMCTLGNAVKGDGTWIIVKAERVISLDDANEGAEVADTNCIDLLPAMSGKLSIVFGDGTGYADYIFKVDGTLTKIVSSANVFETLQTGTDHVVIKDNGINVRIVNQLGSTTVFNVEVRYTVPMGT